MRRLIEVKLLHTPEAMEFFGQAAVEAVREMDTGSYMKKVQKAAKNFTPNGTIRIFFEGYCGPTRLFLPQPDNTLLGDYLPLNELAKKSYPVILEHTEDGWLHKRRIEAHAAVAGTIENVLGGPEEDYLMKSGLKQPRI